MPRITQESIKENLITDRPRFFNPELALEGAKRAVLEDFKDNLRAIFMEQAKAAVEEAVEGIAKSVEGEMQAYRDAMSLSTLFNIKFKVRDF